MTGILSIQIEPELNQVNKNIDKITKILNDFKEKNPEKPLDLVIFPEFFTTGVSNQYVENPTGADGSPVVEIAADLARKFNTNIAAGTVVRKTGEKLYNTMFIINRKGETVTKYDKIHLFKYFGGSENERITPGENKPVVVDLDFGKLGLSICFDIKYPLHYRKLAQAGAQIVVSPSAWAFLKSIKGQKELNKRVFRALSIARANENLFYFVTSNQTGNAGPLGNIGNSMIVSPNAEILAEAGEEEGAIYADIDLDMIKELQRTVPIAFEE